MKRSCDQLGVCQNRTIRCGGCLPQHYFAPGVIDHGHGRTTLQLLWLWMRRALALMAFVAIVSFSAGYLS